MQAAKMSVVSMATRSGSIHSVLNTYQLPGRRANGTTYHKLTFGPAAYNGVSAAAPPPVKPVASTTPVVVAAAAAAVAGTEPVAAGSGSNRGRKRSAAAAACLPRFDNKENVDPRTECATPSFRDQQLCDRRRSMTTSTRSPTHVTAAVTPGSRQSHSRHTQSRPNKRPRCGTKSSRSPSSMWKKTSSNVPLKPAGIALKSAAAREPLRTLWTREGSHKGDVLNGNHPTTARCFALLRAIR